MNKMAALPKTMTVTLTGGSTWDAITIPACFSYIIQARTDVDIKITDQSDGDPYFTLKAGGWIDSPEDASGGIVYYANGTAAVVVEVFYFTGN
jgi:hypothetical protein